MLARWCDYCVTDMKFLIPPDPHSKKANSTTLMAVDDASFMDKSVKELESSLVELKTQYEKVLVNILTNEEKQLSLLN